MIKLAKSSSSLVMFGCVLSVTVMAAVLYFNVDDNEDQKGKKKSALRSSKKKKKAAKKAKNLEESIKRAERWNALSEDERNRVKRGHEERRAHQESVLRNIMDSGVRVVVDLHYTADQTDRECHSIMKQLGCFYGNMKKLTASPTISLHLASYSGRIREVGTRRGLDSWHITRHEESVQHVFRSQDIVYLTPDSPNVLNIVDPSKVYVIGGIVDRSVRKNESYNRCNEQGFATARLPIQEHVDCRTHILNIDTVLSMLHEYLATSNWSHSVESCLPNRFYNKHQKSDAKDKKRLGN